MKELKDRATLDPTNGSSPYSESRSVALERPDHPTSGLAGASIDITRYMHRLQDLDLSEQEAQEFLGMLFCLLWPLAYHRLAVSPEAIVELLARSNESTINPPAAIPTGIQTEIAK